MKIETLLVGLFLFLAVFSLGAIVGIIISDNKICPLSPKPESVEIAGAGADTPEVTR